MPRQRNSLLDDYQRGAEPQDPESQSMKSMRTWLSAFRRERKNLEGLSKKGAEPDIRKAALRKATDDLLRFPEVKSLL